MRRPLCERFAWILMVVLVAGVGSAEVPGIESGAPEAIWLIDDFEDGNLDGWLDGGGSCNVFILNDPNTAAEGSRCLDIFGDCGGHYQGPYISLAGFQAGSFSIYIRTTSRGSTGRWSSSMEWTTAPGPCQTNTASATAAVPGI